MPSPKVPAGQVRWGLADAGLWFLVAQIGSAIWIAVLVALAYSGDRPIDLPIGILVAGQGALWLAYGVGPVLTSIRKGDGPRADYGLRLQPIDVAVGAVVGVVTQLALVPLLYVPIERLVDEDPSQAARDLVDRADTTVDRLALVFLVVVAAPLVEELFYRGLLLRSLERRIGSWPAILVQAAVFAFAHFQPLQFAGLFLFAVIAGWLVVRTGRLGVSWAMHVAFNAVTIAILL